MTALRRTIGAIVLGAALLLLAFFLYALLRDRPQDLPWTPLDLGEPVGGFTGRKLAGLTHDFARCQALLRRAGVQYDLLPEIEDGHCGYGDGVRLAIGGARRIAFLPDVPGVSCPVAAALSMWEWQVVQPAARRHFGKGVDAFEHYGSYACRHIVGSGESGWSEHSTADAVDIAAFRLDDATRITVKRDWNGGGEKAAFLREVRDGACRLFATVLSPDYMPRTTIICISTRRSAASGGGDRAGERLLPRGRGPKSVHCLRVDLFDPLRVEGRLAVRPARSGRRGFADRLEQLAPQVRVQVRQRRRRAEG